jgi:L-aspartate oxidase
VNPRGELRRPSFLVPDLSEREIREITWEYCGIVRDRAGLECAIKRLNAAQFREGIPSLAATELRNIHQVASLIARAALWREESRGGHYRTDFPEKRAEFLKPSVMKL